MPFLYTSAQNCPHALNVDFLGHFPPIELNFNKNYTYLTRVAFVRNLLDTAPSVSNHTLHSTKENRKLEKWHSTRKPLKHQRNMECTNMHPQGSAAVGNRKSTKCQYKGCMGSNAHHEQRRRPQAREAPLKSKGNGTANKGKLHKS